MSLYRSSIPPRGLFDCQLSRFVPDRFSGIKVFIVTIKFFHYKKFTLRSYCLYAHGM